MGCRLAMRLALHALRVDRRPGRWSSRAAVAWLCAHLRLRPRHDSSMLAVVHVMCQSRDQWAVRRAMDTLTELSAEPSFLDRVLGCFEREPNGWIPQRRYWALTPTSVPFLLAPLPAAQPCPYSPRTRLVGYLSAAQQSYPAPGRRDLARWLVDAVLDTSDEQVRAPVAELLSITDQPDLLDALDEAFLRGVRRLRSSDPARHREVAGPHDLWVDRRPTLLTTILRANPHLPPAMDGITPGNYTVHPGVLLAVLKDRLELVDEFVRVRGATGTVGALADGAAFPAPESFIQGCREALRGLKPGPARERLCDLAVIDRNVEARAAAIAAGFVWSEHPAAFLFLTEQWERYDALDPNGGQLRAYCEHHAATYAGTWRQQIEIVAERAGRGNPCPPLSRTSSRHTGEPGRTTSIGSWPTDGGGPSHFGGFDAGGGHGSGYTGGHGTGYTGGSFGI